MSKIYKGWELRKAIADGEIHYGTKFKVKDWKEIVVYDQSNLIFREIFDTKEEGSNYGKTIFDLWILDYILNAEFELIEDEIDIDSIEELDDTCYILYGMPDEELEAYHSETRTTINEILQAVKQIDKRVKKIEEK